MALLVYGVNKLVQVPFSSREEQQAENLRKMLLAMSKDVRVMLIKLCDLDSARHTYGVESEQAETQLRMHDEQLGAILECLRR